MSLGEDRYTAPSVDAEIGTSQPVKEDGRVTDFLQLAQSARQQARLYSTSSVKSAWHKAYRAFHNEHFDGSKYKSGAFRGRTKLFRPKTRSAVRKNEASAAAALFSTVDAVSIKPTGRDMRATVSALVMNEVINYRFDRSSGKEGIPWFLMAMGARQDSQIAGMCISKQYWQFELKNKPAEQSDKEEIEQASPTADGHSLDMHAPSEDGFEGGESDDLMDDAPAPAMAEQIDPADRSNIRVDRPWIELIPPENVDLDPAAPWFDPVQLGGYLRVRFSMHLHEVRGMMKRGSNVMGGGKWKEYEDSVIRAVADNIEAKSVRQSRESGRDRMSDQASVQGDLEIIWVTENFFRWEGEDYHFWSLGEEKYLTDPVLVEQAYPALNGQRPYVGGFGAIESHVVWPMSPVESWQPLQQESNDITNLRLDNIKQNMSPITKVRKGRGVDFKSLRNRGPDSVILLGDMADVEFDRPLDVTGSAYQEMNYLDSSFDELSGNFSGASVQTNRSLNETVGGMKLLSGTANGMTEYDLRIWNETWVEEVIRQLIALEQYYEDNPKILGIAGEKARLYEKFEIDAVQSEMLEENVLTRVDIGIGATNPQEQLQKLRGAFEVLGGLKEFFDQDVTVKAEEVAETIMGQAGYKDGANRFLNIGGGGKEKRDPDAEAAQQQANAQLQAKQIDAQTKMAVEQQRNQSKERQQAAEHQHQDAQKRKDRRFNLLMEALFHDIPGQVTPEEERFIDQRYPAPKPQPRPVPQG